MNLRMIFHAIPSSGGVHGKLGPEPSTCNFQVFSEALGSWIVFSTRSTVSLLLS